MLFGQKRMNPKNHSGSECCWPYLIGQHPLSPVFGQKRPGTPGNSYFAQLPPVFGNFMFLSGGLLDCSNISTWAPRTITAKFRPGDVEIDNIFSFFCMCFRVFFPFILDIKFVGRTSRGHTGGRSHRIFHPSFCGACLNFSREKDSAIHFPRRP